MSSVIISGDTSGAITLAAPAVAGTNTITLPAGTGTIVVNGVSSALVSGTAQASTSGTSIDFTGIPSWVKRITVMFNGVSTSGTSNLLVRIGSGSVDATGYVSSGLTQNSGGNLAAPNDTTGFLAGCYQNNGNAVSGNTVVNNLGSNIWIHATATGSFGPGLVAGGTKTLGGALDRIRITTTNGTDTFDAGSINILYE